jgi:hypothetical protein
MIATISSGHADLADVLFLVAFILFAAVFVLKLLGVPIPPKVDLIAAGLACLALAWFVL